MRQSLSSQPAVLLFLLTSPVLKALLQQTAVPQSSTASGLIARTAWCYQTNPQVSGLKHCHSFKSIVQNPVFAFIWSGFNGAHINHCLDSIIPFDYGETITKKCLYVYNNSKEKKEQNKSVRSGKKKRHNIEKSQNKRITPSQSDREESCHLPKTNRHVLSYIE